LKPTKKLSPAEYAAKTEARVKDAIESIIDMFQSGRLPEAIAQTVIQARESDSPCNKWSLGNRLILLAAGVTDARGFRQWEQVNRKVRKGSRAHYILGPVTKMITEKDEQGNEVKRPLIVGFKCIPVFALEDTEGDSVDIYDYAPAEMPPLTEVAEKYAVKVDYGPCMANYRGYYQPGSNRIMLCTHDVKTFFHELAHAVHHHEVRPIRGGQHEDQEVVAETVAAVLCHLYGYEGYVYHGFKYIESYARDNNPAKAVMRVLADVERVLTAILGAAEPVADDPFADLPAAS